MYSEWLIGRTGEAPAIRYGAHFPGSFLDREGRGTRPKLSRRQLNNGFLYSGNQACDFVPDVRAADAVSRIFDFIGGKPTADAVALRRHGQGRTVRERLRSMYVEHDAVILDTDASERVARLGHDTGLAMFELADGSPRLHGRHWTVI